MEISREQITYCIGKTVRELRKEKQKTIEQLANEINVDYSQISRIERGKINTTFYQLFRIVQALNIPFDEFASRLIKKFKE
jgi:transcriptional regulator with XRE-family HTH domain